MTDTVIQRTALEEALVAELHAPAQGFTFERKDSLEDLLKVADAGPGHTLYLSRQPLVIEGFFDLDPDLLIHDAHLATLGLVYQLGPEDIAEDVKRKIDEATYVRHLLVTNAEANQTLARWVELVLVLSDEGDTEKISKELRDIARKTSYLHALGINFLWPSGPERKLAPKDIHRAFAWLLRKTQGWYKTLSKDGASKVRGLSQLRLKNYRLPGERNLTLHPGSRLHLIHGHNGSGKSALVEAMELAITGKVERLIDVHESDYDKVIRFRGSVAPAEIVLDKKSFAVKDSGVDHPLKPDFQAGSFRLNQKMMDRLTRSGDTERARTFLYAFFKEETRKALDDYLRLLREAQQRFSELPTALQARIQKSRSTDEELEAAVVRWFEWLGDSAEADSSNLLPVTLVEHCLPFPLEVLERLSPLARELQPILSRWQTQPLNITVLQAEKDVRDIDEALQRIQAAQRVVLFETALSTLRDLDRWEVQQESPTADPSQALDTWLELCALADLAEKEHQIALTLRKAEDYEWKSQRQDLTGMLAGPAPNERYVEALKDRAMALARVRDEQYGLLTSTISPSLSARPESQRSRPRLSKSQIDALNEAGALLAPDSTVKLGSLVDDIVWRNVPPQTFGRSVVGRRAGWATPYLEQLREAHKALSELKEIQEKRAEGSRSDGTRFELFRTVRDQYRSVKDQGDALRKVFHCRVTEAEEPLNELLALFTPARWFYERVSLAPRMGDTGDLTFQTEEKARADLRFNMAQLNTSALAIFLLWALQMDNPLRLLVLDDPLENMDELTVTTVARGLAKLLRILPEGWQMMLLFHGEDDLERFRRETPAAVYKLPWLTPAQGEGTALPPKITLEVETTRQVQPLAGLLSAGG